MKLKSMYLVDLYRGSYKGDDFRSKQFDELLLKVHIKIVLVDESYFGNKIKKESQVKFIWIFFSIPIKCNRIEYELAIRTYMDRTYSGVSKNK